jgi:hypothetical protein
MFRSAGVVTNYILVIELYRLVKNIYSEGYCGCLYLLQDCRVKYSLLLNGMSDFPSNVCALLVWGVYL